MTWLFRLLFSFRGRLSRKGWWLGQAIVLPVTVACYFVNAAFDVLPPLSELWLLVPWFLEHALVVKRCNDRNHPTWVTKAISFAALAIGIALIPLLDPFDPTGPGWIVPVLFAISATIVSWLIIDNGILPGSRGPNQYGPDPVAWSQMVLEGPNPEDLTRPMANAPIASAYVRRARVGMIATVCLIALFMGVAPILGYPDLALRTFGRLVLPESMLLSTERQANELAHQAQKAGQAANDAGEHEAAIRHFTHAIQLYGADKAVAAQSYRSRAAVFEKVGNLQEALADYDTAIDLEPDHSGAHRYRAHVLAALGRYAASLTDYEIALRIYPNSARSQIGRGDVLAKLGQSDEALEAYAAAVAAASKEYAILSRIERNEIRASMSRNDRDELVVYALVRRGNVYQALSQPDEALAEYAEALRIWPSHRLVHVSRGWFYESRGLIDLARAEYETAASITQVDDWLKQALDRTQRRN
jgi:tetratricopeptide (TPR) repeat protein/uncharacterized membrane protein YhaH (DUF805 family)